MLQKLKEKHAKITSRVVAIHHRMEVDKYIIKVPKNSRSI